MKLRASLALTTAALAVPIALGVVWLERQSRARDAGELLVAHVTARLEGEGRALCERDPIAWSQPSPRSSRARVEVHTFDAELHPTEPDSPALAPSLAEQAVRGASIATGRYRDRSGEGTEVLVRAGAGPCAWVLARRPDRPLNARLLGMLARVWLPPLLAMVLAVVLGAGPLVRRIRALAAQVRVSVRGEYRSPITVEGSDELAELAQAFGDAAREVRHHLDAQARREQALRDWLANTTHDVMTPLTVLQGHLATIHRAVDAGRPVDRALVAAAVDEAHYTAALVHNLGVAARLDAGEPHIVRAPVDLGRLVERVAGRHKPVARQHGVELECAVPERPLATEGDETFLEQALSNVVYNAIRHNASGGHVALLLEPVAPKRFRLRVIDDGPGIPDDEIARMSERSTRGDAARTRHPGGRGLGLAITRRVAELHGIELRFARSEYGGLQVDLEGDEG